MSHSTSSMISLILALYVLIDLYLAGRKSTLLNTILFVALESHFLRNAP